MRRFVTICLLMLFCACSHMGFEKIPENDPLREMVTRAEVNELVNNLQNAWKVGIGKGVESNKKKDKENGDYKDAAYYQYVTQQMYEAFDPDLFRNLLNDHLDKALTEVDWVKMRKGIDSDLQEKIDRLESSFDNTKPIDEEQVREALAVSGSPETRIELIQQYMEYSGSINRIATTLDSFMMAMSLAINASYAPEEQASLEEVQDLVDEKSYTRRKELENEFFNDAVVCFKDLSNKELRQYILYLQGKEVQKRQKAINEALREGFRETGVKAGEALGRLSRQQVA